MAVLTNRGRTTSASCQDSSLHLALPHLSAWHRLGCVTLEAGLETAAECSAPHRGTCPAAPMSPEPLLYLWGLGEDAVQPSSPPCHTTTLLCPSTPHLHRTPLTGLRASCVLLPAPGENCEPWAPPRASLPAKQRVEVLRGALLPKTHPAAPCKHEEPARLPVMRSSTTRTPTRRTALPAPSQCKHANWV